jgi:hypothetical protein
VTRKRKKGISWLVNLIALRKTRENQKEIVVKQQAMLVQVPPMRMVDTLCM